MSEPDLFDVAVVGGGPAGLAAVTWLARYRKKVAFVDSGDYRNAYTEVSHGYLGSDPTNPTELRTRVLTDLEQYETITKFECRVKDITGEPDAFRLLSDEAGPIEARRVILCTGVSDAVPDIENFFEHYGASVFHCPSCDGYEALGKNVVVFGWGKQVPQFTLGLLEWAASVTVITDARSLLTTEDDRVALEKAGVPVISDEALEMLGRRGSLQGVRLRSGITVACDYAFFSIAHKPHTALAESVGCNLDDEGYIDIDRDGRTSVDGVFAAGDATPGYQVVQVAAGQGAAAALSAVQSLAAP